MRNVKLLIVVSVLAGLLWPGVGTAQEREATTQDTPYRAEIRNVEVVQQEGIERREYQALFTEGPQAGQTVTIGDDEGVTNIGFKNFEVGDNVFVSTIQHIDGTDRYLILDHSRTSSLWWLVILFALVIIWFSRWRGARSLAGLAFSFLIIIGWIVPQIANGANPILVTIAGATVILLASFVLLEGFTRATLAAGGGTVLAMIITGLVSLWAVDFAHLTGEGTEEAFFLQGIANGAIDVRGLLLAGIMIGTLGILDDIAISQVAAVGELRKANPSMRPWDVYRSALRIGRKHLAAIVNTLVLAYAGAALPLLVLFHLGQQDTNFILNGELVATEIVRAIVGTFGLVLALPLTTAMAIWLNVQEAKSEHSHQ